MICKMGSGNLTGIPSPFRARLKVPDQPHIRADTTITRRASRGIDSCEKPPHLKGKKI